MASMLIQHSKSNRPRVVCRAAAPARVEATTAHSRQRLLLLESSCAQSMRLLPTDDVNACLRGVLSGSHL